MPFRKARELLGSQEILAMQWRVTLFGRLTLSQGDRVITRFESSRVAVLLAYLVLHANHPQPREELVEMLWPECDPDVGPQRLRQALYALRRELEPTGTPPGSVLIADRRAIALNPAAISSDVADFERLMRQKRYEEARSFVVGELLPGYYDEWILHERNRLVELVECLPTATDTASCFPQTLLPSFQEDHVSEAETSLSLPHYLGPFLGREAAQQQVLSLLPSCRLTTITGPGGIGKTRFLVETARCAASAFDSVAFVPLAECAAPSQILHVVRAALSLPPAGLAALDQVVGALEGQRVLLLLDNFEQLVDSGGAYCVEVLLARLPQLTCLVTSRRLLGLDGEQEFPLAPLSLPAEEAALTESAQNPSVALFLHRAGTARPGYRLTEGNRADIVALCRALEGIPLALELAASRIRALSPSEMRSQIESRFRWLARSGPGADKQARHRSLAAALEWSWRLLSPDQKRFLAALSIFRGGWTATMAEEVTEFSDARDRLEALTMDSLIVSEEDSKGTTRFRMLEMVRDWTKERLDLAEAEILAQRHRVALLALAQQSRGRTTVLQSEAANLRVALESAVESADADTAFILLHTIDDGWLALTGPNSALTLALRAFDLPGGNIGDRIKAISTASYFALVAQDGEKGAELAARALKEAGDRIRERAFAFVTLCGIRLYRYDAPEGIRPPLLEGLELARLAGESRAESTFLRMLGICASRQGCLEEAEDWLLQSLRVSETIDDARGIIFALDTLGNVALKQDNYSRALALYEECRARAWEWGDIAEEAKIWQNLTAVYCDQERWDDALETGREAVRRNHSLGNGYILLFALWNLAEPMACTGLPVTAAQLMAFISRYWTTQYGPLDKEDIAHCDKIRALVAAALGLERTHALWQAGEKLTLSQAVKLVLEP